MKIDITYDQAQSSLPAGFVAAINYVVAYFDSIFSNNVTVNIAVGFGEVGGQTLGAGDLGESEGLYSQVSYGSAVAALKQGAQSLLQTGADATLPSSSPYGSDALYMTTAEQKALGLLSATNSALDGYVGFSSSTSYSYSATATPAASQYYFIGVAEHEISEVLGRDSYLGETANNVPTYSLMDLFRYSANGVRDLTARPTASSSAYFSVDGGATDLGNWNTNPSGDLGDWSSSAGADPFLAFTSPGAIDSFSAADNELMQTLGWDTAGGPTASLIQTDGSTRLVEDIGDYYVEVGSATTQLTFGGAAVTVGEFGAWTPIGAVATSGGYDVAWKNSTDDDFTVWRLNGAGAYVSNLIGAVAGASYALESLEPTFGQDLNGDGVTGFQSTLIQTDGSTDLAQVGVNYLLFAHGATTGPELSFGGAAVTSGEFGAWTPVGAVATSGGYEVAWKNSADDDFTFWAVNSSGAFLSDTYGALAPASYALETMETTFGQDINGDGVVGVKSTLLQTDGSTDLAQIGVNYFLFAHGATSGPELSFGGAAATSGQFGAWTPVDAVATSGGYEVAWKNSADDDFTAWAVNSAGAFVSDTYGALAPASYALEMMETTFGQDLNGDGVVGVKSTLLQTDGSTDLAQIGVNYFLFAHGATSGPELSFGGAAATSGQFGAWTPVDAVATSGGYEVAWKNSADDDFTAWAVNSAGAFVSDTYGALAPASYALEMMETTFGQDLNGDGVVGVKSTLLQTDGSTDLAQVGVNYFLFAHGGTSGPELSFGGAAVTSGEFGDWTPVDAVATGGGYEVAWRSPASGSYTFWSTDSAGNFTGDVAGSVAANSFAVEAFETLFNQDLNSDGITGLNQTGVANSGLTSLTKVGGDYELIASGGSSGPVLSYNNAPVTAGEFGGWTPLGAEQLSGGGYEVAWAMAGADEFTIWKTTSAGAYSSSLVGAVSGASLA